jgi:hypothetical protein
LILLPITSTIFTGNIDNFTGNNFFTDFSLVMLVCLITGRWVSRFMDDELARRRGCQDSSGTMIRWRLATTLGRASSKSNPAIN